MVQDVKERIASRMYTKKKVVGGGCGYDGLWRFPEKEEAALGNHGTKSPASV